MVITNFLTHNKEKRCTLIHYIYLANIVNLIKEAYLRDNPRLEITIFKYRQPILQFHFIIKDKLAPNEHQYIVTYLFVESSGNHLVYTTVTNSSRSARSLDTIRLSRPLDLYNKTSLIYTYFLLFNNSSDTLYNVIKKTNTAK